MSSLVAANLFAEDAAHEKFLKALISRIARENNRVVRFSGGCAKGGHGRAISELVSCQKTIEYTSIPDLFFVAIDANCKGFDAARKEIQSKIMVKLADKTVIACPEPHIEKWYMADLDSFCRIVGYRPILGSDKCERDRYKAILSQAVMSGGHPPTLGGKEFAEDIVKSMDFFRAGKAESSLKHFLDEATAAIRRTSRGI
ncbi:MAG: hypothetical protein HY894_04075 [Deltaproteobacteria bacterium]|nr:hypothetical protein [Deltaproteobacteria bacterium]